MSTNEKLAPGVTLGRYELLLPIAQGGMATVWAARQKGSRGFQKTVAIKTMLPSLSEDPQFEQMFLDEASLAARIHHPNVAEILDLGEEEDILYIVMEWIDGEALSTITKQAKKLNVTIQHHIGLKAVSQACLGLHAAHELKDDEGESLQLVHRDVSPQNILVTYDGIVKLVDFGVAKAMGRAGGETTAGQLKGKVPYMSPEQARGGQIDRRTDIFAMGIVLYKLTTSSHPFLGENDLVTMKNIIGRPVPSPRIKNPQFPVELEQVILKCLQKEPEKRFQTMLELHQAIEKVQVSMGSAVVDDDVGSVVRSLLGDRGQKRRLALRDAVRSLDERTSQPGADQSLSVRHEGVSELIPTRMASAVRDDILRVTGQHSLSQIPPAPMSQSEGTLTTSVTGRRSNRTGMVAAIGATVIAVAAVVFFLARAKSNPDTSPTAAGPGEAKSVEVPAPLPSTTATADATTTAEITAAPSASAEDTGSTATAEATDDKPDEKKPTGTKKWTGPAGGTTATSAPGKVTPATGTQYVPKITNPGF
ncbi:MAG: serine/threonine-protein kinase [Polyangiaceae bacterium]